MGEFFNSANFGVLYCARAMGIRRFFHKLIPYATGDLVKIHLKLKQLPNRNEWTHIGIIIKPKILQESKSIETGDVKEKETRYLAEWRGIDEFENYGSTIEFRLAKQEHHEIRIEFKKAIDKVVTGTSEVIIARFKVTDGEAYKRDVFIGVLNAVFSLLVGLFVFYLTKK